MINLNEMIEKTPDKQGKWKSTTSRLWKKDVCNFLVDKNIENSLEIGANQGWTSYALSLVSENVYTIELDKHNLDCARKHCKDMKNIHYIQGDAYDDKTYLNFPKYVQVVVIDCVHLYEAVIQDINRALSFFNIDTGIYLIFDDYSHPTSVGVKEAIDTFINSSDDVKVEKYIGHDKNHVINRGDGSSFTLNGPEGVIVSYGK